MPTSLKITVGAIPVASRTTSSLAGLHDGIVTNASYTVAQAIKDWLADGLASRVPKTVSTQREVLEPLIDIVGAVPLRELSAPMVRSALVLGVHSKICST
jgi:hypothetical protein